MRHGAWWALLGAALVLAVVGLVGGYALGDARSQGPARIGAATPVAAESPAAPTVVPVVCAPDPDTAPLPAGLDLVDVPVSSGGRRGYGLSLDVPVDWTKTRGNASTWTWTSPGAGVNTYLLRTTIVAGFNQSVEVFEQGRIAAYQSATAEQHLGDFTIESESEGSFTATFTGDGHCRLTMERVLTLGGGSAYVDVAVTGRLGDREGLADLLARTSASMQAG